MVSVQLHGLLLIGTSLLKDAASVITEATRQLYGIYYDHMIQIIADTIEWAFWCSLQTEEVGGYEEGELHSSKTME